MSNIKRATLSYFKKWANEDTKEARHMFIEMLQSKTVFAKSNNRLVIAGGKMRSGKELNQMLCYADDNLI